MRQVGEGVLFVDGVNITGEAGKSLGGTAIGENAVDILAFQFEHVRNRREDRGDLTVCQISH